MKRTKSPCQICGVEISTSNYNRHQVRCMRSLIPKVPKVSTNMRKNMRNSGCVGKNQYTKAREMGMPIPKPTQNSIDRAIETKRKNGTLARSETTRRKISDSMKLAVLASPESYSSANRGRTKQITVDGIKLQGMWEVDFYRWAKHAGLNPKRPTSSFPYKWNGDRMYHPDFYIESLDLYVEVKGYETDRDRAKWRDFPHQLRIVRKLEISQIRNGSFTLL